VVRTLATMTTTTAGPEHLTHGWEPELAAEDSLLREMVLAMARRMEVSAARPGGRCRRTDAAVFADLASPFPFDNGVVLLQPPDLVDLGDIIGQALTFFADRPWILFSMWPTPDLAAGFGLSLVGHPPVMVRPPGGELPPTPPGLEIVEVRDRGQLEQFTAVLAGGFGLPGGASVVADPSVLGTELRLFLGYADGEPLAVAGAGTVGGVNEVDWVATMPQARGKGYGEALVWRATMARPDRPAILLASDDGQPLYARMGYLRLVRATVWERRAADPSREVARRSATSVATAFADALERRDWPAVRATLDDRAHLREATPEDCDEIDGADAIVAYLQRDFASAEGFAVVSTSVVDLGPKARLSQRFRTTGRSGSERHLDQVRVIDVAGGRIHSIVSVCSGWWKVDSPTDRDQEH
jgi:hypothetical protein